MQRLLFLVSALAIAAPAFAAPGGSTTLDEARSEASAIFDKLDKDHNGTVEAKELHGRIPTKDWRTADPDNDKSITKDEYLAYVETLFKQANKDNDGKLDGKEWRSAPGRKLGKLLK